MNIFFTNECPIQTAREHCYVHRNKQIVEYCQLLSTAHHELDGEQAPVGIYKRTHTNHPSAIWVRQSADHYEWVWECAMMLCQLYTERTGKVHKTQQILESISSAPINLNYNGFVKPPVAAPDEFKAIAVFGDVAKAYQKYLCTKFDEWLSRERPMRVEFDTIPSWYVAS
mgnify:CR=1 FL=1